MAGKLKPCPFCGHDWPLLVTHSSDAGNEYSVRCYQGCCEISDEYRDQAIKEWNTRAAPDVNDELLKALEGIFAKLDDGPSAPGHGHSIPGIWDDDVSNGERAGKPCEWCTHWERARAAIAKAKGEDGEASNG